MSKAFEKIAEKFGKAKNGNKIVEVIKEGVSKGFPSETFELLHSVTTKLSPRHKAELGAYLGKFDGPEQLREKYFSEAQEELTSQGDFNELVVLGQCYSFAGLNDEAISVFESAFEQMENDDDYLFHAMNAIETITLGRDIENPNGSWFVKVPNVEYLSSTLNSILEDFEARIDAVDEDDQIRHYCTLAKCFARISDTDSTQKCLDKALQCADESFEYIELLFMEADEETEALLDGGVSDETEWVEFAGEAFRNRVLEKAKVLAKTEDEKEVLADMMS